MSSEVNELKDHIWELEQHIEELKNEIERIENDTSKQFKKLVENLRRADVNVRL